MDIRHLRSFSVLAKELHFGRAAERLGMAQSALTAQIQHLEETLNTSLLDRNRRAPVQLTRAGELFLVEARKTLSQFEHARTVGMRAGRGEIGRITVGFVASALFSGVLGRLMHGFHAAQPDIEITFVELETPRQIEAVQAGEIDVGFVRARRFPDNVTTTPILTERLVLAVHQERVMRLHDGGIAPRDLADASFVVTLTEKGPGLYESVMSLGDLGNFSPSISHHVPNLTSLLAVVASDLAIAVVPVSLAATNVEGVKFVDIQCNPLQEALVIVNSNENSTPAVDLFLAYCETCLSDAL